MIILLWYRFHKTHVSQHETSSLLVRASLFSDPHKHMETGVQHKHCKHLIIMKILLELYIATWKWFLIYFVETPPPPHTHLRIRFWISPLWFSALPL